MSISVRNISKSFGSFTALDHVSLEVPSGELVALLGPSGSGKTTLLRIIAGLERPDEGSGSILFQDEDVAGRPVGDRHVGFVFQHYALFRHMTVFENVAFGLRVRPRNLRPSRDDIAERVHSLLGLVQLDWLSNRYPNQLSGGQRQRVALARALAVEPKVLLLDEPFGALDAKVRVELRRWLRRLHDEIHVTSVFVTHDQEEALEVSDSIVVMNKGKIEQMGSPDEVYNQPATPFVFDFLGSVNRFAARVESGRAFVGETEVGIQEADIKDAEIRSSALDHPTEAVGFVRPHEFDIARPAEGIDGISAIVLSARGAGPIARIELERIGSGDFIEAILTRDRFDELKLQKGEHVYLIPRRVRLFKPDRPREELPEDDPDAFAPLSREPAAAPLNDPKIVKFAAR